MRGRTLKEHSTFCEIFFCENLSSEIFSDGFQMDMIVARKTIFFLVGCLFTGWVVVIVVNFIEKKLFRVKLLATSFSDTSEWKTRRRRAGLKLQNPGHPL